MSGPKKNIIIHKSKKAVFLMLSFLSAMLYYSCSTKPDDAGKTAAMILGNPEYQAIAYSGYRGTTRDHHPGIPELKEDMKILSAMGIRLLRTYSVGRDEAESLLKAIRMLREDDPGFEMYVMLGAWIDCKHAWTAQPPDHGQESEKNAGEIAMAVRLAREYPEIVKVIAVGNEAMVKWAEKYYVQPGVILKWVNHLQELKKKGELPKDLWITSSDNFASWGGGDTAYHTEDLKKLIHAVDFISVHTYPMHDTHYNPAFWYGRDNETGLSDLEKIDAAMLRALQYAQLQYLSVVGYMKGLGVNKPVHLGETGWATTSDEYYGDKGSRATDEYKSALYYRNVREWTRNAGISCFYFEAFDEQWKDPVSPSGSENHFGLINLQSEAKYAIWDLVDAGIFDGLTRDGKIITKTFGGDKEKLMELVKVPPAEKEITDDPGKS